MKQALQQGFASRSRCLLQYLGLRAGSPVVHSLGDTSKLQYMKYVAVKLDQLIQKEEQ